MPCSGLLGCLDSSWPSGVGLDWRRGSMGINSRQCTVRLSRCRHRPEELLMYPSAYPIGRRALVPAFAESPKEAIEAGLVFEPQPLPTQGSWGPKMCDRSAQRSRRMGRPIDDQRPVSTYAAAALLPGSGV